MDLLSRQRQEAQRHLSIARTAIQRHPKSMPISQPPFVRSSNPSLHRRSLEPAEDSKKVLGRIFGVDVGSHENVNDGKKKEGWKVAEVEKAEQRYDQGAGRGASGDKVESAARMMNIDEDYDMEWEGVGADTAGRYTAR